MTVIVDYKIKPEPRVYPVKCDTKCLDTGPLKIMIDQLQKYVKCVERADVVLSHAEGRHLFEIFRAIAEEVAFGKNELDALITVSIKYKLPMHVLFLAYSLLENYQGAYERYIYANVIKILSDLGFKPMQIYHKINKLDGVYYNYRSILETLHAWTHDEYIALKIFKGMSFEQETGGI